MNDPNSRWVTGARGAAAVVMAAAAAVPACAPGDSDLIVYAGSNWYGHAPVWVGVAKGIFEKHGLTVEERAFGSSPNRVSALESGAAQFASLGEVAMLGAMAAGRRDFYWIGNQDIAPGAEGLVAVGAESIAELRGKSIAVNLNSSVHITAYELLQAHGLDLGTDVTVINAPDSGVVDLVRAGDAVAGCIWEPYFSDLKALPGARVLGLDTDTSVYRRFKTMTGPDMLCASRAWVDADVERARTLFAAYFESVEWCRDNPDELAGLVSARIGKPRDEVSRVLGKIVWLGGEDQQVAMSDAMLFGQAEYAASVLRNMGVIEAIPSFRDWTRPDLLPR